MDNQQPVTQAVSGLSDWLLVLVTLSACFGGRGLPHMNDAEFWLVTRFPDQSAADGLRTRTVLTPVMAFTGFT
ncbi:GntT/GntP/DsdX family permease [Erwinia amylovora]|uniref:GntT/GntP/DsdX family permease n=1 Tax=Erwinia amylovora TaxID=552 RepID=UPI00352B5510